MKLFYAIALILMVLASACAQQAEQPAPIAGPMPVPTEEPVPETQAEETAVAAPQTEESKPAEAKSNEVRMLGIGKYEPLEAKISAGGTVTFLNEGNLKTVVTIKSKGKVITTPIIQPGNRYEQLFAEAGTYEFWGVAYGQGGAKIIVE